jgi:hypothetical protein
MDRARRGAFLPYHWKLRKIMAELTDPQKREIVEALACFTEPAAIITYFQTEHELDLDHKQVGRYDPTRSYYAAGDRWREVFDARRKAYLEDVQAVPIANQGYRLQLLQEGIEAARKARNWGMVASLSKQAAEEVGGVLTNQRNVAIDDKRKQAIRDMTPEDRKLALAEIVRRAQEQLLATDPPGTSEGSAAVQ